MGLSAFEECSSSSSYCSLSQNRSLTKRLLDVSNCPLKSHLRFTHTPEWADGLDIWSSTQYSITKIDLSRRNFEFHHDTGLYLPRYEKPKSAPICLKTIQINSKLAKANLPPERIRHLLRKEKDLLSLNDLSDEQLITDSQTQVPANTLRSSSSFDLISTNDIRLPIHHIINKSSTPDQQLNQDALKSLLEEHLTSLLTRGASTINANRTTKVTIPSIEYKQQIKIDSKLNDERQTKREELNVTPLSTQSIRTNQTSHFIIQQRSPLGLTVTPVDVSAQKNFQSLSLEKLAQQKTFIQDNDTSSGTSTSRPSTEPIAFHPPTHRYQQQQKVVLKRNLDTTNSSSGDLLISNDNLTKVSDQSQMIRKGHSPHGSLPKTRLHKTNTPTKATTIELLPPIVSGKRLHISLANHRFL